MGDRANVFIRTVYPESAYKKRKGVYLYSHWSGSGLPELVRQALAKQWRWNDEPYLTRIIFDVMTEGCHGEELSFGISTRMPDNEYPIIEVDCKTQEVRFLAYDWKRHRVDPKKVLASYSFSDYVALDKATWPVECDCEECAA